jgi:NAD(P)-dependent dehydrogenase (short-subunit alcohol dehydrogenase family)
MDWQGRAAIVTGGASGIGAATAREFAARGARVAVMDINAEAGPKFVESLWEEGFAADFFLLDVSDREGCRREVEAFAQSAGRLDALVNNAASFLGKGLEASTADWERSLGVNVRGCANMVQAAHPHMRQTGGGAVVNVASISGYIAQPDRWTYNACKGALLSLTRCQALDLAADRIRVNSVSPGWTWTPEVAKAAEGDRAKWEPIWARFSMLRRLAEPAEIARAILFLCGDEASFITAADLPVDGGYLGLGPEGAGEVSTFAGTR